MSNPITSAAPIPSQPTAADHPVDDTVDDTEVDGERLDHDPDGDDLAHEDREDEQLVPDEERHLPPADPDEEMSLVGSIYLHLLSEHDTYWALALDDEAAIELHARMHAGLDRDHEIYDWRFRPSVALASSLYNAEHGERTRERLAELESAHARGHMDTAEYTRRRHEMEIGMPITWPDLGLWAEEDDQIDHGHNDEPRRGDHGDDGDDGDDDGHDDDRYELERPAAADDPANTGNITTISTVEAASTGDTEGPDSDSAATNG